MPWDATVMMAGGEFYAVVNCYTDGAKAATTETRVEQAKIPMIQIP